MQSRGRIFPEQVLNIHLNSLSELLHFQQELHQGKSLSLSFFEEAPQERF